jgi:hypothetical protein
LSIHLYLRKWRVRIGGVASAGIEMGGGVAEGLGVDGAGGAPVVVPLNFDRSVCGFFVDDEDAAKDEAEGVGDDSGTA